MKIETLQRARAMVKRLQHVWRACHGPALTQRFPIIGKCIRGAFMAQRLLRPSHYRQWAFERDYPEAPWLTQASVERLNRILTQRMIGFEYGSGRSTVWFGKRIAWLYSVEGNIEWYERTAKTIGKLPVMLIYLPVTLTSEWAEPTDATERDTYAGALDGMPARSLDFVLVDGHFRLACLAHALPKLKDNGILILDNFEAPIYMNIREDVKRLDGTELYANGIWETAIFRMEHEAQQHYWKKQWQQ
jgi:hypothetical protein